MNKKTTMKQKVIDFIRARGNLGCSFSDIQRYIVEDLHCFDYDTMEVNRVYNCNGSYSFKMRRVYRGWWCDALCCHDGILKTYCTKINKRWIHNDFVTFAK